MGDNEGWVQSSAWGSWPRPLGIRLMEDCSDLAREAETTVTPGGSATPGILGSRDPRHSYVPSQALLTLGTERSNRSLVWAAGIRVRPRGARGWGQSPPARPFATRHLPFRAVGASASLGIGSPSAERAHGTRLPASFPHCCDSEPTQEQDSGVMAGVHVAHPWGLGPSRRRHPC